MSFLTALKTALGLDTPAQTLVREFHERADRVAEKANRIVEERNGFAHAAKRMRERGSKKKAKTKQ